MKDWRCAVVKIPWIKRLIYRAELGRSERIISQIKPFLPNGDIIDIGAGSGVVADLLHSSRGRVQALDIRDATVTEKITPTIYSGGVMPFKNNQFELAMINYVLHHTPNPDEIVSEAARIAKRIVILEDIVTTSFNKVLTWTIDSLVNLEIFGHPHSNRSDAQWISSFEKMGITVTHTANVDSTMWLTKPIHHRMYVINTEGYLGK